MPDIIDKLVIGGANLIMPPTTRHVDVIDYLGVKRIGNVWHKKKTIKMHSSCGSFRSEVQLLDRNRYVNFAPAIWGITSNSNEYFTKTSQGYKPVISNRDFSGIENLDELVLQTSRIMFESFLQGIRVNANYDFVIQLDQDKIQENYQGPAKLAVINRPLFGNWDEESKLRCANEYLDFFLGSDQFEEIARNSTPILNIAKGLHNKLLIKNERRENTNSYAPEVFIP